MSDYVHEISPEESARIERFLYVAAISVVAFVLLVIAGIVTADRWLVIISPASERRFVEPYVDWADQFLFESADPELQDYVNRVAEQVAAQMDVDPAILLDIRTIEGDTVNAFTTLGGYVFVFDGLVAALDNENSLAMVLAHEIAHAVNRDPLLSTGRVMLLQLILSSVSGGSLDPGAAEFSSELMMNSYSRDQEQAADLLAMEALQDRYGHVGGATQLFDVLGEYSDEPESSDLLSSHPHSDARIEYLDALARKKGWVERATQPYPAEIQSILRD